MQIDVSKTDTVASVKKLLEPLTGVLPSAQKLMYKKVLQDHESVGEALKPGVKVMLMGTPTASAGGVRAEFDPKTKGFGLVVVRSNDCVQPCAAFVRL